MDQLDLSQNFPLPVMRAVCFLLSEFTDAEYA